MWTLSSLNEANKHFFHVQQIPPSRELASSGGPPSNKSAGSSSVRRLLVVIRCIVYSSVRETNGNRGLSSSAVSLAIFRYIQFFSYTTEK